MKNHLEQFLTKNILQRLIPFIQTNLSIIDQKSLDNNHLWQKIEFDLLKNPQNWLKTEDIEQLQRNSSEFDMDFWGNVYEFFYLNELKNQNGDWRITSLPPERRILGRIYTPEVVIQYICREIHQFLSKRRNLTSPNHSSSENILVADISCGTGRFLLDWIGSKPQTTGESYFGYDIDSRAIEIAQGNPLFQAKPIEWHNLDVLVTPIKSKFDVIIGNPPYIESRAIGDEYWEQLRTLYTTAYKKFDLSVIFIERTLQLLRPGGLAGIIITNKWLVSDYGQKIRELMLKEASIYRILDLSEADVFKNVSTYPMIIFFEKRSNMKDSPNLTIDNDFVELSSIRTLDQLKESSQSIPVQRIPQSIFHNFPKSIIPINIDPERYQFLKFIWDRIGKDLFTIGSLDSPYEIRDGIHTGNIKDKLMGSTINGTHPNDRKIITSRKCVSRYNICWQGEWIHYSSNIIEKERGDYAALRERWIFESSQKIVIKLFGKRLIAARDSMKLYANNSLSLVIKKPKISPIRSESPIFADLKEEFLYLEGILNSGLITAFYNSIFAHTHVRGEYIQFYIKDLELIPLPRLSTAMLPIIREIMELAEKLEEYYSQDPKMEQIMAIEKRLDQAIFTLYQIPPTYLNLLESNDNKNDNKNNN